MPRSPVYYPETPSKWMSTFTVLLCVLAVIVFFTAIIDLSQKNAIFNSWLVHFR